MLCCLLGVEAPVTKTRRRHQLKFTTKNSPPNAIPLCPQVESDGDNDWVAGQIIQAV